jgi:tetratricopeptide (TPR) repeat protein
MSKEADSPDLRGLMARSSGAPTAACPDEMDWIQLALGATSPERESWLLNHVVECAHCAVLFRHAVQSRESADEDESEVTDCPSDAPAVITAAAIDRRSPDYSRLKWPKQAWIWAAAALLFATVAVWFTLRPEFGRQRGEIASSFQKERPFPYRVAGVPWGPLEEARGARSPRVLPIPKGNTREERIWAGRAALWEGDYDRAQSLLRSARAQDGDLPELLNDLAVAYAAGGDRTRALALLRQASARYPRYPPILFNLACLLVQDGKTAEAEPILQEFPGVEPDEKWRREASRLRR